MTQDHQLYEVHYSHCMNLPRQHIVKLKIIATSKNTFIIFTSNYTVFFQECLNDFCYKNATCKYIFKKELHWLVNRITWLQYRKHKSNYYECRSKIVIWQICQQMSFFMLFAYVIYFNFNIFSILVILRNWTFYEKNYKISSNCQILLTKTP